MNIVCLDELFNIAGVRMNSRNMSAYNGNIFDCVCGHSHTFNSCLNVANFGTTGNNARMIVICPIKTECFTLIQTRYKFLVVFDKFISLAGYVPEE